MKHSKLIKDLGGSRFIADELNQSQPTVSNWRQRGIPWRWRHRVAKLAKRAKVELPDDFFGDA